MHRVSEKKSPGAYLFYVVHFHRVLLLIVLNALFMLDSILKWREILLLPQFVTVLPRVSPWIDL